MWPRTRYCARSEQLALSLVRPQGQCSRAIRLATAATRADCHNSRNRPRGGPTCVASFPLGVVYLIGVIACGAIYFVTSDGT